MTSNYTRNVKTTANTAVMEQLGADSKLCYTLLQIERRQ